MNLGLNGHTPMWYVGINHGVAIFFTATFSRFDEKNIYFFTDYHNADNFECDGVLDNVFIHLHTIIRTDGLCSRFANLDIAGDFTR